MNSMSSKAIELLLSGASLISSGTCIGTCEDRNDDDLCLGVRINMK